MFVNALKPRNLPLYMGLLVTMVVNLPAQTSDIVCPGSWKQVRSSGPPPQFGGNNLVWVPRFESHGEVVLFGGSDLSSNRDDGTWTWDGTVWIHAANTGPSPRVYSAMAYDYAQRQLVLFGGVGTPASRYQDNQDTWEWNATKWTQVATGGPSARNTHGMAYDGLRRKVVLFGGGPTGGPSSNDTWEWDGKKWDQRFPASAPSPRQEFGMVYDTAHALTVLFGGTFNGNAPKSFGETWTWDGTVWTHVTDAGPGVRFQSGMTYDSARKRVVLFGGANAAGQVVGGTWEWDGAEWTQVATSGPAPRAGFGMAYDKARGKVVLFAGITQGNVIQQDTWEWTGPIYGCSSRAAGDVNCDGKVDRDDLTLVQSALGLSACAADDPRDLNQDGKIDALDAQLLVNKCTTFGCPYVKP